MEIERECVTVGRSVCVCVCLHYFFFMIPYCIFRYAPVQVFISPARRTLIGFFKDLLAILLGDFLGLIFCDWLGFSKPLEASRFSLSLATPPKKILRHRWDSAGISFFLSFFFCFWFSAMTFKVCLNEIQRLGRHLLLLRCQILCEMLGDSSEAS